MADIKIIFGNNVKKLRKKLNLSQDQFSEKIDIAPTTLSTIESGKAFTTADTINKICNTFCINPLALFEHNSNYIIKEYGKRRETVNDIIFMLNNLDDDKLKFTANFIQLLNDNNIDVIYKKNSK